ncbi:PP2C family serine/threonine-protein phosphatase [Cellulomonas sp. P24]|uniref:PP2C family protein-serine/threonine phosphatase n=1 Tax=Cellulomonas sp. P24 TaxID=2885206 RepID=UPI00216AC898|nr:protein phosphatase 2C domain-containing protein [Cellulomonas sp. P24]MCR6494097.1 protein phosphatase 2C domain-containing protein [Cellulomonas sp. P24]
MRTTWGSATDRGLSRDTNEDALLASAPVFLVADGMGGEAGGAEASRVAVEEFARLVGQEVASPDEIHACFRRTGERLVAELAGTRAGTTVAGVAVTSVGASAYWLVFNIGDSRVYRWVGGVLDQITVDHSVVQELVDSGELAAHLADGHPKRHVITRALGTTGESEPDYWMIPAGEHDRLLICTDGLSRELGPGSIADALRQYRSPQDAAGGLVSRAIAAGGRDNVSVVVVDVASGADDTDVTGPSRHDRVAPRRAATWGKTPGPAVLARRTRERAIDDHPRVHAG